VSLFPDAALRETAGVPEATGAECAAADAGTEWREVGSFACGEAAMGGTGDGDGAASTFCFIGLGTMGLSLTGLVVATGVDGGTCRECAGVTFFCAGFGTACGATGIT